MEINFKPSAQNTITPQSTEQRALDKGLGTANGKGSAPLEKGNDIESLKAAYGEKKLKQMGAIECATCAARRYVDGSNDGGVSFKTPGKIAPEASAAVVMGHEMEHVANEKASAQASDREIVSQSVILNRSICPECGISYVSGGTTSTVSKKASPYEPSTSLLTGIKMDQKV